MADPELRQSSPLNRRDYVLVALLLLVTGGVYWQVGGFDYVRYDDDVYVMNNPVLQAGLTLDTCKWAFTTLRGSHWHPMVWLTMLTEVSVFGLSPRVFHLGNLFYHLIAAALFFRFFRLACDQRTVALFIAGVFALHPLHVESVAWVTERKDVLYGLFWAATLNAYLAWLRRPARPRLAAALGCFALGALSKPMIMTLPLTLLLLDVWPLARLQWPATLKPRREDYRLWRQRTLEKCPFFVVMLASIATGVWAQSQAIQSLDKFSLPARLANVASSYLHYLIDAVWPANLVFFYPHPGEDFSRPFAALAVVILTAGTICAWRLRHRAPRVLVGWCWFLGTLVPVIGLVQVGTQARADRFVYVPLIGISICLSVFISRLHRRHQQACLTAVAAILLLLSWRTWSHLPVWRNTETLFRHAETRIRPIGMLHNNLGVYLSDQGRHQEAIPQFLRTLELEPSHPKALNNLGEAYLAIGELAKADAVLVEVLDRHRNYDAALYNLATVRLRRGLPEHAIPMLATFIARHPANGPALARFAHALAATGDYAEAAATLAKARIFIPDHPELHAAAAHLHWRRNNLPRTRAALAAFAASARNPEALSRLKAELRLAVPDRPLPEN